jgi:hypothetical protein
MEENSQSLPQDLRTKHPKRWTTENVCPWMTGWDDTKEGRHLDTKEGRQSVTDIFTKETGETFDVERIKTWYRNHKTSLDPK